jgi:hypothetical protein
VDKPKLSFYVVSVITHREIISLQGENFNFTGCEMVEIQKEQNKE